MKEINSFMKHDAVTWVNTFKGWAIVIEFAFKRGMLAGRKFFELVATATMNQASNFEELYTWIDQNWENLMMNLGTVFMETMKSNVEFAEEAFKRFFDFVTNPNLDN